MDARVPQSRAVPHICAQKAKRARTPIMANRGGGGGSGGARARRAGPKLPRSATGAADRAAAPLADGGGEHAAAAALIEAVRDGGNSVRRTRHAPRGLTGGLA